jgi:Uma2 family endonuclease
MLNKAMKKVNVRFNYNDYMLLPEDRRFEILDGDPFMIPAPGIIHQRLSLALSSALFQQLSGFGTVLEAPCDVLLSGEDIVQPDILFVRKERKGIIGELNIQGSPDLIVEILSPGTRERDLKTKRKIYSKFGILEYWIVDPEAETVEVLVWSEIGYVKAGLYAKWGRISSPLLPNLQVALAEVFQK